MLNQFKQCENEFRESLRELIQIRNYFSVQKAMMQEFFDKFSAQIEKVDCGSPVFLKSSSGECVRFSKNELEEVCVEIYLPDKEMGRMYMSPYLDRFLHAEIVLEGNNFNANDRAHLWKMMAFSIKEKFILMETLAQQTLDNFLQRSEDFFRAEHLNLKEQAFSRTSDVGNISKPLKAPSK